MAKLIVHPLRFPLAPIQQVLRDLAAQENCDGEPYDQMILAANYIDELEKQHEVDTTRIPAEGS